MHQAVLAAERLKAGSWRRERDVLTEANRSAVLGTR